MSGLPIRCPSHETRPRLSRPGHLQVLAGEPLAASRLFGMVVMVSTGDSAQIRKIGEQIGEAVADAAIKKFVLQHPEVRRGTVVSEIPAPLKWAAAVVAALFTAGTATLAFWLFDSVSSMSVTLARMDERMASYTDAQAVQMQQLEGRVDQLENYHREGGR